jgi:hypothetical protein
MNEKIEQAKDKIAQGYGYNDWKGLEYHYQIILKSFIPEAIWNQVCERYHELMDEWISVDTPPEIDSRVMLLVNSLGQKYVCIGVYKGDNLYKKDKGTLLKPMEVIEKWKPLPKQ